MKLRLVCSNLLSAVLILGSVSGATAATVKETCVTQYGGATECKKETIAEEVVHGTIETKPAGLAENLYAAAGIMVVFSLGLFGLAKAARRAYFLD